MAHGEIELEFFASLLEQMKKFPPALGISLHLGGEPLLHPRIDDLVRLTHEILGKKPMMATNAVLLDAKMAKRLSDAGGTELIVDFSQDKARYEHLRTGAIWEQVRDNLWDAFSYENLFITIRSFDENIDGLTKIFGIRRNLAITQFNLHSVGGDFSDIIAEELDFHPERKRYYVCTHPWFGMAITWEGKVAICCHDVLHRHIIGDLRKSTIAGVWNCEEMKAVRAYLRSGKIENLPLCRKCSRPWNRKNSIIALLGQYAVPHK